MADKLRTTFPITVTLGSGEQPTAAKINSVSKQAKNGLAIIERAVGDIWTQSGDSTLGDNPLQISNLARIVGEQNYLNAKFSKPNVTDVQTIRIHQNTSSQQGQTEVHLDFTPVTGASSALDTELSGVGYTTRQTLRDQITANTDYYVDTINGIVYFGSAFNEGSIEYDVLGADLPSDGSSESAVNVIPHPNMEDDWRGLKFIQLSANKYLMVLPPRRPLKSSASEIGKIPRATNNSVIPAASPVHRYWYVAPGSWSSPADITADADHLAVASDKRYRHALLSVLEDVVEAGALGTELPSGTMYLWDGTNKTIVEGITFKVPDNDTIYGGGLRPGWVIQIEGNQLDNLITGTGTDYSSSLTTDDPADYKQRFSLITIGEDLSKKANQLSDLLIQDDRSTSVMIRSQHSNQLKLNPKNRGGGDTFVQFPPGYRDGDDHTYLLSREGSTSTVAAQRDRWNNAMLGDFLLASTTSTSNYQNLNANSRAVRFGSMTGPALLFDQDSTLTVVDGGGTVATSSVLALQNNALALPAQTLWMTDPGDANAALLLYEAQNKVFTFLGRSGTSLDPGLVSVGAGQLKLVAPGTDDFGTGTENFSADINFIPKTGSAHQLNFSNEDLVIFGFGQKNVMLGAAATDSHVYVDNNRVYFNEARSDQGTGVADVFTSDTYMVYDAGTSEFKFRVNENISGSVLNAGALRLNGNSTGDTLVHDGDATWSFQNTGQVSSAHLRVGTGHFDVIQREEQSGSDYKLFTRTIYLPVGAGWYKSDTSGNYSATTNAQNHFHPVVENEHSGSSASILVWDLRPYVGQNPRFVEIDVLGERGGAGGGGSGTENFVGGFQTRLGAALYLGESCGGAWPSSGSGYEMELSNFITYNKATISLGDNVQTTITVASPTSGDTGDSIHKMYTNNTLATELDVDSDGFYFVLGVNNGTGGDILSLFYLKLTLQYESLNDLMGYSAP